MDCYIFRRENAGPGKRIRSSFRCSRLVRFANSITWSTYRFIDEMSWFAALQGASVSLCSQHSHVADDQRAAAMPSVRGEGWDASGGAPPALSLCAPALPGSATAVAAVLRKQHSLYTTCLIYVHLPL